MKRVFCLITLIVCLTAGITAFSSQANPEDSANSAGGNAYIYVKVYESRLEAAKARIETQKVKIDMEHNHWQGYVEANRRMHGTISAREVDGARYQYEAAKSTLLELEAEVKEIEATIEIAKARASLGLDMPMICR